MMAPEGWSAGQADAAVQAGNPENQIRFLGFNQDVSRLSVGTAGGSRTYRVEPFELLDNKAGEGTSIVERLFTTQLVAQVSSGENAAASSQRCVRIINAKTEQLIKQLSFASAVLAVKMNRLRMAIVLENTIYMYDLSNLHLVHTIEEIPNIGGVCALAACAGRQPVPLQLSGVAEPPQPRNYLAYASDADVGTVYVYDALNLQSVTRVEAHSSAIGCLALSDNGELLATASAKGTVIRVWTSTDGAKLFELRRGLAANAHIFSMAFSADASLLCVSSDSPTIHVFKLEAPAESSPEAAEADGYGGWGLTSLVSGVSKTVEGYMPGAVATMWSQIRCFAWIKQENPGVPSICSIVTRSAAGTEGQDVLVMSFDGYLRKYSLDLNTGGECVLVGTRTVLQEASARSSGEPAAAESGAGGTEPAGGLAHAPAEPAPVAGDASNAVEVDLAASMIDEEGSDGGGGVDGAAS